MLSFVDVADPQAIYSDEWDAVIVISADVCRCPITEVALLASHAQEIDKRVGRVPVLLMAPGLAGGRLIVAPAQCDADYGDVSVFAAAAIQAVTLAQDAGATRPLLWVDNVPAVQCRQASAVAALACGQALWQPLEARQAGVPTSIQQMGLINAVLPAATLTALEAGRSFARDLCGTEPERMSAIAFANTCTEAFAGSAVTVEVIAEPEMLQREYPLLSAVARASFAVPRHQPRVVKLEYCPSGPIEHTLLLAGKGVIYDTGGASLKVGGTMSGMSRDKGGAAAIAGLMLALSKLQLTGVRVVAELGLVRNSIGSDAMVPDEIITTHAGIRVRIGNSDAEGRLVLTELLSHLRLQACDAASPELISVATLTSHAARAFGSYPAMVFNSVARESALPEQLQHCATLMGEPMALSPLHKEDFMNVADKTGAADVISAKPVGSSQVERGHQLAAAFMLQASGLAAHGIAATKPLPFIHLDIAGAAVSGDPRYGKPTSTPLLALWSYLRRR